MQDYENYLVWTARFSDLVQKIQDLNPEIEYIDHSNYREIFEKLSDYLRIDQLITNTELHPFLANACFAAKNLPDHEFKIIYTDLVTSNDLSKFDLCDEENHCDISKIRQDVFDGMIKFFEKAEYDIDSAMTKADPDYNHNLHFINYEKVLDKVFEKFEEFNKDEENGNELIERFKETIEKYKNFQYGPHGSHRFDLSFKFDIAKFLSIFESETNSLPSDFDQTDHFNIKIDENSKNMHKFMLNKYDYPNNKSYDVIKCAGGVNYLPKCLEKVYLVFFEHTINTTTDMMNNMFIYMYSEVRFEVLFEYLASKNFKSNEEISDFFKNISYQDLYKEFDQKYQEFKNRKPSEIYPKFMKIHFDNYDLMHLKNKDGTIVTNFYLPNDFAYSVSWRKPNKEIESMSEKQNIFEQIASGFEHHHKS